MPDIKLGGHGIKIGHNIRCLRLESGITQKELASKLNVSIAAVSRWEHEVCYPDITLIPQIAKILDISIDALFNYDDQIENHHIQTSYLRSTYTNKKISKNNIICWNAAKSAL